MTPKFAWEEFMLTLIVTLSLVAMLAYSIVAMIAIAKSEPPEW